MNSDLFNYQATLADSIALLLDIQGELYCTGFNICLIDELKDFAELMEDGEEVPADIAILESSDEPMVKEVLAFILLIDEITDTIRNLNPEAARIYDAGTFPDIFEVFEIEPPEERAISAWTDPLFEYRCGAGLTLYRQVYRLIEHTNELPDDVFTALYGDNGLYARIAADHNAVWIEKLANRLIGGDDE